MLNKSTAIMLELSALQQNIINNFQKDFPLCEQPYQAIAQLLDSSEQQVLEAIEDLNQLGVLSRVGPVFDHKKAGASTLAAIAAPPEQIDKIAGIVNQFEQVNHNYAREHDYNLWFVVTASDPMALAETLQEIELLTGLPILVLPMEASYHIDLGFKINFSGSDEKITKKQRVKSVKLASTFIENKVCLNQDQQTLLRGIIEKGLPTQTKPYAEIADKLSGTSTQVINQIEQWQNNGLIRRFGLVVKHRKLGFNANAMVVWDIPADKVDEVGELLSLCDAVTLCYQRPRQLPEWNYNLFSMIHGQDRDTVLQQLADIVEQNGLTGFKRDVLFSYKLFKQCGGQYVQPGCTEQLPKGLSL